MIDKQLFDKAGDKFEINFARTSPEGNSIQVAVSGPVSARSIRTLIKVLEILAEDFPIETEAIPKEDA